MPTPVVMPKLGMTMREGMVRAWPVAPGERVEKGAPVVVIETEKAEVEVEATATGFLRHVYVELDETLPCGTLLAALTGTPDEPFDAAAYAREHAKSQPVERAAAARPAAAAAPAARATGAPAARARAAGEGESGTGPRRRKAVAPAARALARKLGVDAEAVPGSGPGGRVTREDVQAFAERRVAVGGGVALEVLREGEGEPVLLLPGFGADVSSFALLTPALLGAHELIGVNPRGVGLSDAPEADAYEVSQAAEDAAAVLAGAAAAHVVGASLGAAVALELALAHPARVRSLSLITPFLSATPRLLAVTRAWARLADEAGPEALARALLPWLFSDRLLADAAARERCERGLARMAAGIPAAGLARAAAGLEAWSGTRAGALGGLEVATLVIEAGGDLLTPDAAAVAAAIPGARSVRVPEAGHAVAIEAPGAVAEAIAAHVG